ncbi:MAG: hypothetical protein AABW51_03405 [Nanoarchaeota archaeon]
MLKRILNEKEIPYTTNRPKEDIAKEVEEGLTSIQRDLVARILE